MQREDDHDRDHDRDRHSEQVGRAHLEQPGVVDRHGRAARREEARAARDAEHAKRADEGRHPKTRDQEAVDQPGHQRDQERGGQPGAEREAGRQAGQRLHDARHDHRAQAHDEADREVDPAQDDDEGLAETEQERRRRGHRDALDVEAVEQERDAVGGARPALEEDQQRAQEQPRPSGRDEAQPGGRLGLSRLARRCRGYRHARTPGSPARPPIGLALTILPPPAAWSPHNRSPARPRSRLNRTAGWILAQHSSTRASRRGEAQHNARSRPAKVVPSRRAVGLIRLELQRPGSSRRSAISG